MSYLHVFRIRQFYLDFKEIKHGRNLIFVHVHFLLPEKSEAYDFETKQTRPRSLNVMSPARPAHRPGNGLVMNHLLAPVVEQELGRRHSIDVFDKIKK